MSVGNIKNISLRVLFMELSVKAGDSPPIFFDGYNMSDYRCIMMTN